MPSFKFPFLWFSLACARLAVLAAAAGSSGSPADYAPTRIPCPPSSTSTSLVRVFSPSNQTLHPSEVEYVKNREQGVIKPAWSDWLGDGSLIGYDTSGFVDADALPRVGIALSGGGYRASQFGAGVLNALDSRNASAKASGTGGLLQVATYLSALSGGSWLASSLYSDSFPTIPDMVFGNGNGRSSSAWLLDLNLVLPGGDIVVDPDNLEYFAGIVKSLEAKADAGFNISLGDAWSRMLSYHFLSGTSRSNFFSDSSAHGAGQLWSDLSKTSMFSSYQVPLPFIVADTDAPVSTTTDLISEDAVVYEFSPFEFASFDPALSAAANLSFVGTSFSNGVPTNSSACVTGFDQIGAVMGTSSDLFNELLGATAEDLIDDIEELLSGLLDGLSTDELLSSRWPNPFRDLAASTFPESSSAELFLVDGGSNGEGVPFNPLLVKAREVDVIVAVDSSADSDNSWPQGSSLIVSTSRITDILNATHQQLPPTPQSMDDFVADGVNMRPTFFGCDPEESPAKYPLVIYIPNSPPLTGADPSTNTATLSLEYSLLQTQVFLDQAFSNTIGGFVPFTNSPDPNFGKCLQCAAIDRARTKVSPNVARSAFCTTCFQQYCFDPSNPPSNASVPNRQLVYVNPDPSSSPDRR